MRKLLLLTLALVLLDCSTSLAQPMGASSSRNMPRSGMSVAGVNAPHSGGLLTAMPVPGLGAPGTIPTLAGALGAIPLVPGTAATIARGSIGSVIPCTAAPGFSLDASSAMAFSGALATPPLPGATVPPNPSFGGSLAAGGCNPAIGTQDAIEALGIAGVIAPTPGLATISGPSYSDATVPAAITEAGSSGLSPLITVPSPFPCGTTTMVSPTILVMTDPTMTSSPLTPMSSAGMTSSSAMTPTSSSTVMTGSPSTTTPDMSTLPSC